MLADHDKYDALLDLLADLVIEEIEQEAEQARAGAPAKSALIVSPNKKPAQSWQTSARAKDFNDAKITRSRSRSSAG
jgi:hypothetical protein